MEQPSLLIIGMQNTSSAANVILFPNNIIIAFHTIAYEKLSYKLNSDEDELFTTNINQVIAFNFPSCTFIYPRLYRMLIGMVLKNVTRYRDLKCQVMFAKSNFDYTIRCCSKFAILLI